MSEIKPYQIEKILLEISELKELQQNARAILKHYRISSDKLSQLTNAIKELKQQVEEEKKYIEDDFLSENDYVQAKEDELKAKVSMKEKNAILRELLAKINTKEDVSSYDYNINGELIKMQVQKVTKVYLNGKEAK